MRRRRIDEEEEDKGGGGKWRIEVGEDRVCGGG